MRAWRFLAALVSVGVLTTGSQASEIDTYFYDAMGRLVSTQTAGTSNNGIASNYSYDPAGNRTNVGVSGVPTAQAILPRGMVPSTERGELAKLEASRIPNPVSYGDISSGSDPGPGEALRTTGARP